MIFRSILLSGLFLAGHSSAAFPANAVFSPSKDLETELRRDTESVFSSLTQRQNDAPDPKISTTPQSGDASKLDLAAWAEQTKTACDAALSQLPRASNPSGLAVCYNLPFVDNTTGVFQAELRMYNISAPIDPWVGVTAADVNMRLFYPGATVKDMNGTFTKRDADADAELTWPPIRARSDDDTLVARQTGGAPAELKVLMYVGKINPNLMGAAMTQAALQPLLIPEIQLSAINPRTKQPITATLSSKEASFINGVFSKQSASNTNEGAARASATAEIQKAAPFVLPGTSLAFFPTGLVITCVWTAGFFGAVGYGTIGRIQFREQYRRRMKREMAMGVRTI